MIILEYKYDIGGFMLEERRPQIMTIVEVAKYLRVNRSTIYRFIRNGQISAIKIGNQWRFRKETIEKFLLEKEKVRIK